MKPWIVLVVMLLGLSIAQSPITPQAALERLFRERPAQAAWFAQGFLNQVPPAQIDQIVAQLEGSLGKYQRVTPDGPRFRVELERGYVPTEVSLDAQGRIDGLLFRPPVPNAISPEQVIAQLRSLPGQTSLLVLENGQTKHSLNPEAVLAIGSTFKLTVLDALQRQIAAGRRKWDDLVSLRAEWKSLPSGTLQDQPDGLPISLQTYATQMISISDNTATDALIGIVGRANVEALTTPRNRPFLSTREAFVLKNPRNREWLERYRSADAAGKAALLPQLARLPLPSVDVFASGPVAIDVEWFYSVRELCEAMARVQALPLMTRNPGLANPADWSRVAYKGGSEPGVLNLTTWLTAKDGRQLCVSATWNNPQAALDEGLFFGLYGGLLSSLK